MNYKLNIKGKPFAIDHPLVMGILNCTPDSFYADSRKQTEQDIISRTKEIIAQGGDIIDVGAMSTRPNGTFVAEEEEVQRLRFALPIVKQVVNQYKENVLVSVDSYRAKVARMAVEEYDIDIINDVGCPENNSLHGLEKISHEEMYRTVAELHVPYILMTNAPTFVDALQWFNTEIAKLHGLGVKDIIIDPGYGFGKTIEQNYQLFKMQHELVNYFERPLLAGVSRKRMIYQTLGISPGEALNGTTVLNTIALERGAAILRVHDVREAKECVKLLCQIKNL